MKQIKAFLFISFVHALALNAQPCDIPPSTNNCENTPILCSANELDGYCTSMSSDLTFNAPAPICVNGGAPHNPIWFAFYAGCTEFDMTIVFEDCDVVMGTTGIQAALYSYTGGLCPSSTSTPDEFIACNGACPSQQSLSLHPVGLVHGNIYYLVIDGCAGSACDLTIMLDAPCGEPYIEDWSASIEGPVAFCTGQSSTYSIDPPLGANDFSWYLDGINIYSGTDQFIEIEWTMEGTYELCLDVSNQCISEFDNPLPQCLTITVADQNTTDPYPVLICANETYSYGGEDYPPGIHEVQLTSSAGCDSVVTLTVNSAPVNETDLGTFYLCESDAVMVANTPITCNNEGSQEVILQQAADPYCDSILTFEVVCVHADAYVFPPPILGNGLDTVELDGFNSFAEPSFFPTYFDWYRADTTAWQWLGDSSIYLATELGTYCLVFTVVSPDSMAICSDTACVVVDSIMSAILPIAISGDWQISPVPAKDLLSIQCQGETCPANGTLECRDILGRNVATTRINHSPVLWEFSVATWPPGPYWITWTGPDGQRMLIGKAIVQR